MNWRSLYRKPAKARLEGKTDTKKKKKQKIPTGMRKEG